MDINSFLQQRMGQAQSNQLSPEEERLRAAHIKQHGYPKDSNLPALVTLFVKAKSAERLTKAAAYHAPPGKRMQKPSRASLRLLQQAQLDLSEKKRWIKNFLKKHPEQKPDWKTVRGNFFVGVNDYAKAEVGSPQEKDAMALMMMAKRLASVLYEGKDLAGDDDEPSQEGS